MSLIVKLGTSNSTGLSYGLKFLPGYGSGMSPSNIATISQHVLNDLNPAHPKMPQQPFSANGLLYVPNRGVLQMLPGDYVGVDAATGWPILLSARAIAAGPWTVTT